MFRLMQRFSRDSQARGRGTEPNNRVRRRNHQLNCEALEGRQLLSFSGYYLANAYSGKVLDDPGGSSRLDAVIEQYQLNGGTNQLWQIVPLGYGYSRIVNTKSGEVLFDSGTRPVAVLDRAEGLDRRSERAMADLPPSERHC